MSRIDIPENSASTHVDQRDSVAIMDSTISSSSCTQAQKQHLKLPSFSTLGIANPHSYVPPTPPEETDSHQPGKLSTYSNPRLVFGSQDSSPSSMTDEDLNPAEPAMSPPAETPTPTMRTIKSSAFFDLPEVESAGREEQTPGSSTPVIAYDAYWTTGVIEHAVQHVLENKPVTNVISLVCHSQPCPLPSQPNSTSIVAPLVASLENRTPADIFIDITHAVPLRFSMAEIPQSPQVTPKTSLTQAQDYFSMQTTFSKAVIATDYHDVWKSSVPSSPHPVVPPASVQLAILERFIPPADVYEAHDLFSSDAPSALIDRLTELSFHDGTLIFIYPTQEGARTFIRDYLSPILDPQLRTMAGVYNLTTDLGAQIAQLPGAEAMSSFVNVTRKLNNLLRNLSQPPVKAVPGRPRLRYEIAHSAAPRITLDRKTWAEWWIHQERGRMLDILKRYFARGQRLPSQSDATEAGLAREVINAIRTRPYDDGDSESSMEVGPNKGMEVGLWIIRKSVHEASDT